MKILNIKTATKEERKNTVYIGRPSKWGNPFIIDKNNSRETVVLNYTDWILTQPQLLNDLSELRGHNLLCYCAPKLCHGHVLQLLVEECKDASKDRTR